MPPFFARAPWVPLTAIGCCLLWGSAFPAIKTGYLALGLASDDTAAQILFAGCRFFGSGLILLALGSLMGKRLWRQTPREWGQLLLLGLMQTSLQYVFFYIGLAHTTGIKAAIISATGVFFSVLLAHFLYRSDRLSPARALGCLIGLGGVALANLGSGPFSFDMTLLGEGFMLIAAMAIGLATLYGKRLSQHIDPLTMTAQQLTLGGLVLVALGLAGGGRFSLDSPGSGLLLGYLALLSALAFLLWSYLIKFNPVGKVVGFKFLIPLFGASLSALFLGEHLWSWNYLAALPLVCLGVWLVTRPAAEHRRLNGSIKPL